MPSLWKMTNTIRPVTTVEVINVDNILEDANYLYDGFLKSMNGSSWKSEVQQFEANFLLEIAHLHQEVRTRTYKSYKSNTFILKERGKIRLIHGLRMRDRVLRHVFCDHVLNPVYRPKLIYDNYASLQGRGITMARRRFANFLHRWYRKHGRNGAIMLIDYSGFYDNLLHEVIKSDTEPLLEDEWCRWFLSLVLSDFRVDVSYMTEDEKIRCRTTRFNAIDYCGVPQRLKTGKYFWDKSVNIGDQTSQSISVYYPHKIDNFVKIVCGIRYYGRYMDDSFVIGNTKEELRILLQKIKELAEVDGIFIDCYGERRADICREQKIDVMIDDDPYNYKMISSNKCKCLLFDDRERFNLRDDYVTNWLEVEDYIEKLRREG